MTEKTGKSAPRPTTREFGPSTYLHASRTKLPWLQLLSITLGTNSVTAKPIFERWKRAHPNKTVSEFETFLRLHGVPFSRLAETLDCDVKRLTRTWRWYAQRYRLPSWHHDWMNGYMPLAIRQDFIERAIRSLERIPAPPKPARLAYTRKRIVEDLRPPPPTTPPARPVQPSASVVDSRLRYYHGSL